ncbi:MAG: HAMP domain-containing histidine kinase [Planctomycetes bacterium]|nr:HAMP domain-containing histidine kinase [Planctomycetota bacterium]
MTRKTPRDWRLAYFAGAAAVLAALFFVTRTSLRLEAAHRSELARSRALEEREERRRNALWRLDARVLPLLARESARPYFEYLAYYPQECGYTRYLSPLDKGDVLVASPLLLRAPAPLQLHFQIDAAGRFSSPQVPEGNQLDLAQATCSMVADDPGAFDVAASLQRLQRVAQLVAPAAARAAVVAIEAFEDLNAAPVAAEQPQLEWVARQNEVWNAKRAAIGDAIGNNRIAEPQTLPPTPPPQVVVGPLVPWWVGDAAPELFLVRRVTVGEQELLQGVWCDWKAWRAELLAALAPLLPGADLVPLLGAPAEGPELASALSSIPARLVLPPALAAAVAAPIGGWSATRTTLALAWLAVVAALLVGGRLVGSSVALAQRRHRFASAVTHELRTPLTTFRLYSEMLADGMVTAPEQRQSYLQTLKEQSARLATLVENVLAYARLEERGTATRRTRVTLAELVERHAPSLARRASDAGFEFRCTVEAGDTPLDTDPEAVGQVLFNLVDNACKYGRGEALARIELCAAAHADHVALEVRDHGSGVAAALRSAIFEPFERGARNDDARPGVGLGLALARGLARDLGGELELLASDEPGARLCLRLPRAR